MTFKKTVTNYLSNKKDSDMRADLLSLNPAVLFTNKGSKNNRFGDIYLFNNFGYATSNNLMSTSNITTHYTEQNVTMNDHWAIAPEQYTLSGVIGEVVYNKPHLFTDFIQKRVTNYLQPLTMLSPTINSYTQSAINVVGQIESTLDRYGTIAQNIYQQIKEGDRRFDIYTNQQLLYESLRSLQLNRQLVTIYTPYKELQNMAITSIIFRQENSTMQSNIEITLQEWRDVEITTRQATETEKAGFANMQKQVEENSGVATTQDKGELKSYAKEMGLGNLLKNMIGIVFQ